MFKCKNKRTVNLMRRRNIVEDWANFVLSFDKKKVPHRLRKRFKKQLPPITVTWAHTYQKPVHSFLDNWMTVNMFPKEVVSVVNNTVN